MTTTDAAVTALQIFKNVILEGPPGTGKTFSVAAIASAWPRPIGTNAAGAEARGSGPWVITFHPSTGYEEFVEGIRYNPKRVNPSRPGSRAIGFELRDGVFPTWIAAAREQPDKDFLVLIDEINRANVSKVLGDLLLGLEASKRLRHDPTCTLTEGHETCWSGVTTQLPYSNKSLGVPDNLYVLATMNTSDRSIAPLDSALRRRFAFVRVEPLEGEELQTALSVAIPNLGPVIARSASALDNVNLALRQALGPDALLGHSYLFDLATKPGRFQFWMEVRQADVTWAQIQTTQPFAGAVLAAVGSTVSMASRGSSEELTVHYDGTTYENVMLEFTTGNVRFAGNGTGIPFAGMSDGVTIWTPVGDRELELEYRENAAAPGQVADLKQQSDIDWTTSARGLGRMWSTGGWSADDTERAIWRYGILPQLIETVSQTYSLDLLTPAAQQSWLDANLTSAEAEGVMQGLNAFDAFLKNHLQLQITLTGHGLAAGLGVVEYHESQDDPEPQEAAESQGGAESATPVDAAQSQGSAESATPVDAAQSQGSAESATPVDAATETTK